MGGLQPGIVVTRRRSLLRHVAFALVSVRTLAFAAAPSLDSHWAPDAASATAAAAQTGGGDEQSHDPARCPACLLLLTAAFEGGAGELIAATAEAEMCTPAAHTTIAWGVDRASTRSRAPPGLIV
jgi:hypothetical protein